MATSTPVLFIHGLWLHARSWDDWVDRFAQAGYDASAPGWPGDPDTVEEARSHPDAIADHGIDDVVAHFATVIDALPAKPLLIGHSFGGMIAQRLLGEDQAVRRDRDRRGADQGRAAAAALGAQGHAARLQEPGQQASGRLAHRRAVPLRLRQRHPRGGVRRAVREVGDPRSGQAVVRGRGRELQPALAGQGRHRQPGPRAAAADHGRSGPHRPRGGHEGDPQAVPPQRGHHRHPRVPRPRRTR